MTKPPRAIEFLQGGIWLATIVTSALLAAYAVFGIVLKRYDIKNLMPPPGPNRYDVREIYMGPLAAVCPGLPSVDFQPALENCVRAIHLDDAQRPKALEAISIPTFEEFQDGKALGFKDNLSRQGKQNLLELLKKGQSYLLGVAVPEKYFSRRKFGDEPYSMGFYAIRDANICIDGSCGTFINWRGRFGTESFPLYNRPRADSTESGTKNIFFAANDGPIPVGLALNQGLFIAKDGLHLRRREFFSLAGWGKPTAVIFFLVAFLIICIIVATTTGYIDYAMLGFVIVSMIGLVTILSFRTELANLDGLSVWRWTWFLLLNLLLSSMLFSIAAIRERWRALGLISLAIGGYTLIGGLLLFFFPKNPEAFITHQSLYFCLYGLSLASLPTLLFVWDAWRLKILAHASVREDHRLSLNSRITDQIILGANFVLIGLIFVYISNDSDPFSTLTGNLFRWGSLFLATPMVVLLRASYRRQVRNDHDAVGRSESTAVELRHGSKAAATYRARERYSVMPIMDLSNSTKVTDQLDSDMHWIMYSLRRALDCTLAELGLTCHYDKRNGDCILILASSPAGLKDDFTRLIAAVRRDLKERYRPIVQFFHRDLDIHPVILAIPAYKLGAPPEPRTFTKKSLDDLMVTILGNREFSEPIEADFISAECNYLMKYAGDLKVEAGMLVLGGPIDTFPIDVLSSALVVDRIATLMAKKGKVGSEQASADHLQLIYAIVSEDPGAVSVDDASLTARLQELEKIREAFALSAELQPKLKTPA